jgi:hypothetical protein
MNAGNNASQNYHVAELLHLMNGVMLPMAELLADTIASLKQAPRLYEAPYPDAVPSFANETSLGFFGHVGFRRLGVEVRAGCKGQPGLGFWGPGSDQGS